MFARLRNHADSIEAELQVLERSLDMKTKSLFSILNAEVSGSSVEYMKNLIAELEEMNNTMSTLVAEATLMNSSSQSEYDHAEDDVHMISDQLSKMEDHLTDFGFVKNDNLKSETSNNNYSQTLAENSSYLDNSY